MLFTKDRLPQPKVLVHQRQQVWILPLLRTGGAWRGYLFASWTSAGEVLILSVQRWWQVAHVHLGEHMASNRVLRGLDPVHMPIPVSKTIFIWVCTPLVAVRFSASEQLVCSNLLVIVVTVAGSGSQEVSRGRRKELEKE
jgi:hypothetical protein